MLSSGREGPSRFNTGMSGCHTAFLHITFAELVTNPEMRRAGHPKLLKKSYTHCICDSISHSLPIICASTHVDVTSLKEGDLSIDSIASKTNTMTCPARCPIGALVVISYIASAMCIATERELFLAQASLTLTT